MPEKITKRRKHEEPLELRFCPFGGGCHLCYWKTVEGKCIHPKGPFIAGGETTKENGVVVKEWVEGSTIHMRCVD